MRAHIRKNHKEVHLNWFLLDLYCYINKKGAIKFKIHKSRWASNHDLDIFINISTSVTPMSIVSNRFSQSRSQGSFRCGQLERKSEIHNLLEVGSIVADLVDNIFQADDISSYVLLDLSIWFDMNSLFTNFSM